MNAHPSPEEMMARLNAIIEHYGPGDTVPGGGKIDAALPLDTICAADFASELTPYRRFLDSGSLMPMRNVTIFSGDGGTGKSLAAMQLGAAVATGTEWLGLGVRQGSVLFLSAEDDEVETHIRLKEIAETDGLDLNAMTGLRIAVLAGQDAVLGQEADKGSRITATPLLHRLKLTMHRHRPVLLILDNLADIFAGNENVRPLARQFISMLRGLAIEFDCAVLLLAHPSLSGITSGSGTSGNTAWSNSARSRLYLVRDKDEQGAELDPNQRVLKTMKANYGPTGAEMRLKWEMGRFIRTDLQQAASDPAAKANQAERVFLHLVDWHARKGIHVSPHRSTTYAPVVFSRHPQAEGITKFRFEQTMAVLLEQNRIRVVTSGPPSKLRSTIERVTQRRADD